MNDKPQNTQQNDQQVQEPQDQEGYVWEFPCSLPIKIMGPAKDTLEPLTKKIIQTHVPDFVASDIRTTSSKTGKYISITVSVIFINKQQIDDLFAELAYHQQNGDDISFVI
jgi:putative lipoic acid-binding regulatory protein